MVKGYILCMNINKDKTASSKAKLDMERFTIEAGFTPINDKKSGTLKRIAGLIIFLISGVFCQNLLLIQHPFANLKKIKFIKLASGNKLKVAAVVHDLNLIRYPDLNSSEELNLLNFYDIVIVHNSKMKSLLQKYKLKSKIYELGMFDYFTDENFSKSICNNNVVCFAGNLDKEKSGFIYKLNLLKKTNYSFELYGPNYFGNSKEIGIVYKGSFDSEKLPNNLLGRYGLVWDGKEIDSCSGDIGEYLKFINPHKASLYVVSELPIICWSKAAIADYVKKNEIGLCIDSLEDLDEILNNIDDVKYNIFLKNIKKEREKLVSGYYIKNVLKKVIS